MEPKPIVGLRTIQASWWWTVTVFAIFFQQHSSYVYKYMIMIHKCILAHCSMFRLEQLIICFYSLCENPVYPEFIMPLSWIMNYESWIRVGRTDHGIGFPACYSARREYVGFVDLCEHSEESTEWWNKNSQADILCKGRDGSELCSIFQHILGKPISDFFMFIRGQIIVWIWSKAVNQLRPLSTLNFGG